MLVGSLPLICLCQLHQRRKAAYGLFLESALSFPTRLARLVYPCILVHILGSSTRSPSFGREKWISFRNRVFPLLHRAHTIPLYIPTACVSRASISSNMTRFGRKCWRLVFCIKSAALAPHGFPTRFPLLFRCTREYPHYHLTYCPIFRMVLWDRLKNS